MKKNFFATLPDEKVPWLMYHNENHHAKGKKKEGIFFSRQFFFGGYGVPCFRKKKKGEKRSTSIVERVRGLHILCCSSFSVMWNRRAEWFTARRAPKKSAWEGDFLFLR